MPHGDVVPKSSIPRGAGDAFSAIGFIIHVFRFAKVCGGERRCPCQGTGLSVETR